MRTSGSALSTLPLRFEDTWRAGLGANYRLDERRKLRLGTAWDLSPVRDEFRTPRLPDEDRAWAAAGFEWKLGDKTAVLLSGLPADEAQPRARRGRAWMLDW